AAQHARAKSDGIEARAVAGHAGFIFGSAFGIFPHAMRQPPLRQAAQIGELADAGVSAFILSGYPHLEECDLFAKYVMPSITHGSTQR
ncbi:MAG: hypothetical protein RLZZ449_771, partial [Actinomycetota bacterium]